MDLDEHNSPRADGAPNSSRILLIAGSLETGFADPPPTITESLRIIRAVGSEGRGNGEASVAWKKLAENEAATLLPILDAMDGANDYALIGCGLPSSPLPSES